MIAEHARRLAEQLIADRPPADEPARVFGVTEYDATFVVHWSTERPRPPGCGPIAVPKDGRPAFYLSTQRLDVALFVAGLGPDPGPGPAPDW